MGIIAYSLLWIMQDLYPQPYTPKPSTLNPAIEALNLGEEAWLAQAFGGDAQSTQSTSSSRLGRT